LNVIIKLTAVIMLISLTHVGLTVIIHKQTRIG